MPINMVKAARRLTEPFDKENWEESYDRLINLYRFQIGLYFPLETSFPHRSKSSAGVGGDRDRYLVSQATSLATAEIVRRIIDEVRSGEIGFERSFGQSKLYSMFSVAWDLFENYVWHSKDGLRRLALSGGGIKFDSRIKEQRRKAKWVAKIIYVLFHAKDELARLYPTSNGLAAVMKAITDPPKLFKCNITYRTLQAYWAEMESTAIFHYLIREQRYEVDIRRISGKHFIERTLDIVNDSDHLSGFLRTHDYIAAALNPRGYEFPTLNIIGEDVPVDFTPEPPSAELLARLRATKVPRHQR